VVNRHRLAFEQHDVEHAWIIDQPEAILRRDPVRDLLDVLPRLGCGKDKGRRADAERREASGFE
jgi:hypothetical protein